MKWLVVCMTLSSSRTKATQCSDLGRRFQEEKVGCVFWTEEYLLNNWILSLSHFNESCMRLKLI